MRILKRCFLGTLEYMSEQVYMKTHILVKKCIYKNFEKYLTLYSNLSEVDDNFFAILKLEHLISIVGEHDSLLFSLGKLYLRCGDNEKGQYYIERSKIVEINKAG